MEVTQAYERVMARTRTLTTLFALGRMGFGLGLLAKPEAVAWGWIGELAQRDPVRLLLRAVGGRDIALSAGALLAGGDRDRLTPWLAGAVVSDLTDVASTLAVHPDSLPANARWGTVALGGGSALAGAALIVAVRQ